MDISRHISNLLYRHDCVIIPGFGGFVCNPVPAKIHKSNGVITPPTKSIAFNRQLQTNDGLLINEIAEKEGITFELASQRVIIKRIFVDIKSCL